MAKEAVDECLAPVRAMRAKKQAELEVAKMDEKIATHEAKISEICTEKEINFDTQEDFEFCFDVALAPEIKIELSKNAVAVR